MYRLNKNIIIRLGIKNSNNFQIVVGEGSERNEFITSNRKLVSCLTNLKDLQESAEIIKILSTNLDIENEDAENLLEKFLEENILVQDSITPLSETMWEKWGWRDALDLHRSSRNLLWRHDYSNNPEVMTWYFNDQLIEPDTPAPKPNKNVDKLLEVQLPTPTNSIKSVSIGKTLHKRRTWRNFESNKIDVEVLSDLLYESFKVLGEYKSKPYLKKYGITNTYSLGDFFEIYPIIVNVDGVESGAYYYSMEKHSIYQLKKGNFDSELIKFTNNQNFMDKVAIGFVFSINWSQYMWKYRFSRSYRFALFEISSLVQTFLVYATGLNLKTFLTPAIKDSIVKEFLNIEDDLIENPIYMVGVGV